MRNLKKFLALVLAMMMVFSLMVSVNAAADYTDRNQVSDTYQEAVDVTDALGIFRGRDGNTFQPQSNVRRDEFATVLYRLATGDVEDKHLDDWRGIVSFADIPADNWAAPYVAYAYSAGLMQGDGTNFHPTLPINGYDAALTLLRLLGYGKKGEYTGSYQLNVAIDGARIGLTNVVGTRNLSGNATREIIAELAYDALNCDMVYFDPAGGIYQNDNRWDNAKLGAVIFDMEIIRHGDYKNPNNTAYGTWDLMRDFQLTPDVFFRPDPVYVVLMKDQVIYEGRPTPVATYNGNFTEKDAQPYITAYNTLRANVTLYYNGVQVANPMTDTANTTQPTFTKSSASNVGLWIDETTGIPGYEIEIYDITTKDDTITQYRVVVREATLAEVGETNESTGEIDLVSYYYSPVIPGAVITDGTNTATGATLAIPKTSDVYAALAAHEEDDLVAAYILGGAAAVSAPADVLEIAELQEVKTTVNHIDRNTWKYTTTSGAVYQRTKDTYYPSASNYIDSYGTTGDTYLYLLNGYILYRDPINAAANTGYAYLDDVKEDNQGWEIEDGGKIYIARLYLADGSVVEVKAVDYTNASGSPTMSTSTTVLAGFSTQTPKRGELVWYSVGANGVYTVRGITSNGVTATTDLEITTGKAEGKVYTTTGATSIVYDSKTVFFVVTTNAKGNAVSVQPYVGISSVPNVTASVTSPTTVVAAAKRHTASTAGVDADAADALAGGRATAVLIKNPIANTVNNYFIVGNPNAEKITEGTGANRVEYYVYNAVVGGKITTVKVGAGTGEPANGGSLTGVSYYSSVVERNGIITAFGNDLDNSQTGAPGRGVYYIASSLVKRVSNTVISVGSDPSPNNGNYVSTSLKAYIYDTTEGTIRSVDLSKVNNTYSDVYMVLDSSSGIDVLTELYLVAP